MRNIQSRQARVEGSSGEHGSRGRMCSGCVRQARGVYDSVCRREYICVRQDINSSADGALLD